MSQIPSSPAGTTLPVAAFSTEIVRPHERLDAWRGLMGSAHEIAAEPDGFEAEVRSVHLDRMLIHRMTASPQQVKRSARRIRSDGLEHFVLHLSTSDSVAETSRGSVALRAGTISVNDLTRPSDRSRAPEAGSIILSLSRDLVGEALGHTDGLHGLVLDDDLGRIFTDHVRALATQADRIPVEAASKLSRASAHLFAACVAGRVNGRPLAGFDDLAMHRARRHIDQHLGSPNLSPDQVASAAAVSRTSLFRMFQPFGGVSSYIQDRRLDRIRSCLLNPGDGRTLAAIAFEHGFASMSHFSRAFKGRFDCTPREMRLRENTVAPAGVDSFAHWVRGIG